MHCKKPENTKIEFTTDKPSHNGSRTGKTGPPAPAQ